MNTTFTLPRSLASWGSDAFDTVFKQELISHREVLPLQQALTMGNYVADSPLTIVIIRREAQAGGLQIRLDVFYQSIIAGCSCADDPSPITELNEMCSLLVNIHHDASAQWQWCE